MQRQRARPQLQRSQQQGQIISEPPNTHLISEYMYAMQTEINVSKNYKDLNSLVLTNLSRFLDDKSFKQMKRDDIVTYLNSLRKSDENDPMHKWIGTYNMYLACITRFFKWVYNPTKDKKARPKPKVVENVPNLKRKEQSIYKPSDLWSTEDDLLFLKWCPSKRDRCYHAISRDLSARPHEILGLKIKDIVFKNVQNKQYAEVLLNGKTGTRHIPLIDSIPYVKDWLDSHPCRNKPESYFIYSNDRRRAHNGQLRVRSLHAIYLRYRQDFFPKLLDDPLVPDTDKQHIRDLLGKPWNPYIRRHSALTQKSAFLKEHILRQHGATCFRSCIVMLSSGILVNSSWNCRFIQVMVSLIPSNSLAISDPGIIRIGIPFVL
jgi:integrase/recombinase XerD